MQTYSDPKRESEPHALPDVEVFELTDFDVDPSNPDCWRNCEAPFSDNEPLEAGWYWWTCLPGCLPDSEPFGPFASEKEAEADAQDL